MAARTYLDYAASAPLRDEAREAMGRYERSGFAGANPNSLHSMGREAARALDGARRDLVACLGGGLRPSDVVWTSGGTEANNLAVLGMSAGARARDARRRTVVLSAIEHDSVLDLAPALRERGFEVRLAPCDAGGTVTPELLAGVVDDTCALVSVMSANNETGVVQPVEALASVAHGCGALFHTDAGGPVGVGALALRPRTPLRPQSFGGGQEQGRRAGTQDVRGALGFAAAARACHDGLGATRALVASRAQALYDALCAPGTGIVPTAGTTVGPDRLPGIVSVMTQRLDSETLVLSLDQAGFEVSAGSACSSGSLDPSHVLTAMGIPSRLAYGSLRVSFDERADPADLERLAQALLGIVSSHPVRRG